jgi:hypothetical protein
MKTYRSLPAANLFWIAAIASNASSPARKNYGWPSPDLMGISRVSSWIRCLSRVGQLLIPTVRLDSKQV